MMKFSPALLLVSSAYAQAPAGAPPAGGFSLLGMMPLLLIVVVMYFLMIRPQQKKQKAHQAMIAAVKPGDEVVTAGGMYGTVAGVDDKNNTVYLKVSNDVKIRIERFSIARVVTDEPNSGSK
ncbi:MAG TPA: preprotein translocase subunit YajC [bacterium]|jgi:preprotein translocase subunit YajC